MIYGWWLNFKYLETAIRKKAFISTATNFTVAKAQAIEAAVSTLSRRPEASCGCWGLPVGMGKIGTQGAEFEHEFK